MLVAADDLSLLGVAIPQYTLAGGGFSYDGSRHIATWTFNESIPADKLRIHLSDAAHTPTGNALDGEWTDVARTFSSGNGTPGGDFDFRFNVLPGDVNQDLSIDTADVRMSASRFWTRPGDERYNPLADFIGLGAPTLSELIQLRNLQGAALPDGEPGGVASSPHAAPAPAAALVVEAVSLRPRLVDDVMAHVNDFSTPAARARLAARRTTTPRVMVRANLQNGDATPNDASSILHPTTTNSVLRARRGRLHHTTAVDADENPS